jgi:hypothetical protein
MPFPIKPIHELEEHNDIFGHKDDNRSDISSLQQIFLENSSSREASKNKYSEEILNLLENIYNSVDELTNAASTFVNPHRQANVMYRVPESITDNDLLGLKTQGLVVGSGRSVNLTEKGNVALRDKWLVETNQYKINRQKDKFDIRTSSSLKFKKIDASGE